jgi:hypothetical protein
VSRILSYIPRSWWCRYSVAVMLDVIRLSGCVFSIEGGSFRAVKRLTHGVSRTMVNAL